MNLFIFFILQLLTTLSLFGSDIAVVTLSVGDKYNEATHLGILSKSYYCKKHGYDFIVCIDHIDKSRPIQWSKIALIKSVLEKYKWVFFTDADSLVMNYSIKLTSFIDDRYNMLICKDTNPLFLNTGHFFLKNTPWSFNLLRSIYNMAKSSWEHAGCYEQSAFTQLLLNDNSLKQKIKVFPGNSFNSCTISFYGQPNIKFEPGDFILHFMATHNLKILKEQMQQYALESMSYSCNQEENLEFFLEYLDKSKS